MSFQPWKLLFIFLIFNAPFKSESCCAADAGVMPSMQEYDSGLVRSASTRLSHAANEGRLTFDVLAPEGANVGIGREIRSFPVVQQKTTKTDDEASKKTLRD